MSVNIEEINTVNEEEDGDVLFTSSFAHLVATNDLTEHDWIIDSRAYFHVTPNKEWFTTYDVAQRGQVWLGNGYACEIVGVGDMQIKFKNGSTFTPKNAMHAPMLTKILISMGQLDDASYSRTIHGR